MNVKSRSLPIGITAIALVLCVAAYLSWDSDLGSSSQPGERSRMTPTTGEGSLPSQAIRKQSIQQMIDSGQFDPPPGSAVKLHSAVSPFSRPAQAEAQRPSPTVDSSTQGQPGQLWVAGAMPASGSDNNASAGARQEKQPASNQALSPTLIQAPAQTPDQSQPVEFESPPGVGSPKGGT